MHAQHSPQGSKIGRVQKAARHACWQHAQSPAARGALQVRTVAALKTSHLVSLQAETHRHTSVSTLVDYSSGVDHRQDSLFYMLP